VGTVDSQVLALLTMNSLTDYRSIRLGLEDNLKSDTYVSIIYFFSHALFPLPSIITRRAFSQLQLRKKFLSIPSHTFKEISKILKFNILKNLLNFSR
jgi:hypothetical protein